MKQPPSGWHGIFTIAATAAHSETTPKNDTTPWTRATCERRWSSQKPGAACGTYA